MFGKKTTVAGKMNDYFTIAKDEYELILRSSESSYSRITKNRSRISTRST